MIARSDAARALVDPQLLDRYHRLRHRLTRPIPADYRIAGAVCDRWAVTDPQRRALLDLTSREERWWTFADVAEQSRRLANGLAGMGITRGDRVAVVLPQGPEAAITHLAVYRLAAIAVPVSVMHGSEALAHRLHDSGSVVAVIAAPQVEDIAADDVLRGACRWVVVGHHGTLPGEFTRYDDLATSASAAEPAAHPTADTPAVIIYTSGTTGQPKGAVHAHRVVAAHGAPISLAHDGFPCAGDLLWSPADWAWAGGLIDCLLSAWHAGVPVVAFRGRHFEPDQVVGMMATWEVRNAFLPPTAIRMLQEAGGALLRSLRLRSVMTGGEPVGEEIIEWCRGQLGLVPNTVYGQTEASCVVGSSGTRIPAKPGALGLEYPGSTVAVLASEETAVVPDGDVGELCVRADGPGVFLGYWRRPDSTAAKVVDGWLRSGDLGVRDDDGYFWFAARADDVILSAGYRIGPAEIESCLEGHPAVRAAAVVGAPDAERGQVVHAYLELNGSREWTQALRNELERLVRTRLAPYEVPRSIEPVDILPRTVTGKIQRRRLRDRHEVGEMAKGARP